MRKQKRLTVTALLAALCVLLAAGCGQQESGMELSVCVGGSYSTLDPIYAEDIPSQTVLVHLYENLMRVVADQAGNSNVAVSYTHLQFAFSTCVGDAFLLSSE